MRPWVLAGLFVAPVVGLATGVWAEFAELGPPLLLAVATPAIIVSVLSAARITERSQPIAVVLTGAAVGLLTFSMSAGLYIAFHYLRGGGFDVNDDEAGGSAAMFFAVHVGVGAIVGLVIGVAVAALAYVARTWNKARRRGSLDPRVGV